MSMGEDFQLGNLSPQDTPLLSTLVLVCQGLPISEFTFIQERVCYRLLKIHLKDCLFRVVTGPGIPRINSIRGGFMNGVRTRYHSFFPSKLSEAPTYDKYSDLDSEDDYDRRPTYSSRSKYYEKRPQSPYYGNVFLFCLGLEVVLH